MPAQMGLLDRLVLKVIKVYLRAFALLEWLAIRRRLAERLQRREVAHIPLADSHRQRGDLLQLGAVLILIRPAPIRCISRMAFIT